MYVSGRTVFGFFFATTTLIIAVPTAIKVYNWVLTLCAATSTSPADAVCHRFIFTFINGGLTGLFLGNADRARPAFGHHVRGRALHMVMAMRPSWWCRGIYHWYPKITGGC